MPASYTSIGPLTLRTFTLLLGLAILAGALVYVYRMRDRASPGALVDVSLSALAFGLVGARLEHVLLNWGYFNDNPGEALQLSMGGLSWHGAVAGGLAGFYLLGRWRHLRLDDLLNALALAVPLVALGGWWGCWAAACGYGKEVDTLANHPSWAVSELRDIYGILAPRYNTQQFGMALAVLLLLVSVLLIWRGWLPHRRFWIVLALLGIGMFGLGFLRADGALLVAGLRADQWLDGMVVAVSAAQLWRNARSSGEQPHVSNMHRIHHTPAQGEN